MSNHNHTPAKGCCDCQTCCVCGSTDETCRNPGFTETVLLPAACQLLAAEIVEDAIRDGSPT